MPGGSCFGRCGPLVRAIWAPAQNHPRMAWIYYRARQFHRKPIAPGHARRPLLWWVRTVGPHDFGARAKPSTHGVDLLPCASIPPQAGSAGPCPAAPALVGADHWCARFRRPRKPSTHGVDLLPCSSIPPQADSAGPCPTAPALVGADRWCARFGARAKPSTHGVDLLPCSSIPPQAGSAGPCPAAPALVGADRWCARFRPAQNHPRMAWIYCRARQFHRKPVAPGHARRPLLWWVRTVGAHDFGPRKTIHAWRGSTDARRRNRALVVRTVGPHDFGARAKNIHAWRGSARPTAPDHVRRRQRGKTA